MSTQPCVLHAQHITHHYAAMGIPALNGISLRLHQGQAVGLLGPNGSGKSTLINLLIGALRLQQGVLNHGEGSQAYTMAYVPQEYAFYPELTCRENLNLFAGMLVLTCTETVHRVEKVIAQCQLQEFAHRRAHQCSGGVRRRLNLGIALLQQPDILLLDEPTVGVDPQSRAFLLERVRELVANGTAVLYATHYMEEISAVCSKVLLLDHGRVVVAGDLTDLLRGSDADGTAFADLEALFMHYTQHSLRDQ